MSNAHEDNQPTGPYATAAGRYWANGWRGVLPLPPRTKKPVPAGFTGANGTWPSYPDVHAWTQGPEGAGNLALRMPHHVIGLDVDAYDGKGGGDTLDALEVKYGPLPSTWRSTSRGDGISGIRLYRVPEGLAWPGDLRGGIEIIQHKHRYTVAWPSIHPGTGATYRWIDPHGNDTLGVVPDIDNLPDLPDAWVAGITGGVAATDTARADLGDTAATTWLEQRITGAPCRVVQAALARHISDLASSGGSRHDVALRATGRLTHLAGEGHHGVGKALDALLVIFTQAITTSAGRDTDPGEWRRMVLGGVNIAAAAHPDLTTTDPCENPFYGLVDRKEPPAWNSSATSPTASPKTGTAPTTAPAPSTATTPNGTPSPASPSAADATATAEPTPEADDDYERAVLRAQLLAQEVERQRAVRDARRHLDDEEAAKSFREPPWRPSLVEELAIPDEPVSYLVDQVFPTGANVLLTAQFKAGKTTLVNHLTRCVADHEPFLGVYPVADAGRIAVWNYEVDDRQYRRWLRDLDIANPSRVTALNLRGYRLPLVVARIEDWVVRWLEQNEIAVWVVDPFARAFTGSGDSENDNTEVGRFLDTLDVIKTRAGVSELVMPVHTGRAAMEEGQERARGATRLDDWADVRWLLTKDSEDNRYFRASGRDVEVPEGRLEFDPTSRSLSVIEGESRKTKNLGHVQAAVMVGIALNPGLGLAALRLYCRNALTGVANAEVDLAIRGLASQGRVRVDKGGPGVPTRHWADDLHSIIGGTP